MITNRRWAFALIVVTSACTSASLAAQDTRPTSSSSASKTDAAHAVMSQRIAVRIEHATIKAALASIAAAGQLHMTYSPDDIPTDKRVTVVLDDVTVADALHLVLQDTDLEWVVSPYGHITVRRGRDASEFPVHAAQGTATVSGFVRDSVTGTPILQATIRIDGMTVETKSGTDGAFRLTGLAAGSYRVTARRVGYIARSHLVTVEDGQTTTLNFLLNPPVTRLDEIVTTATGEQRRYAVGNVISTINVDSIAPTAPVASVTDLISGRAPGVEVMETGGLVGSGEAIRIRGQSSLAIASDPIIIVDGMREDNSPGGMNYSGLETARYPTPSRINDLDFSQIASIDILKGPAATTEYGTDAANGVIIITTKRGVSGTPQWHASAEQAASALATGFPDYYASWGHAADGSNTAELCPLTSLEYAVRTTSLQGRCVVDSVTHFNPLNEPRYSIFGTGPSSKYDLEVSGGSEALRYYVGGSLSNAVGATHLPQVFDAQALALGYPASQFKPNAQNQGSLRANTNIRLRSNADLQVDVSYLSSYQEAPGGGGLAGLLAGPANDISYPDSAHFFGYGNAQGSPLWTLGNDGSQQTTRFTGSMTTNWRFGSWLTARAIVGVDHGSQTSEQMELPQSALYLAANPGGSVSGGTGGDINLGTGTNDTYTVDVRATATATPIANVRAATSVGAQYVDNRSEAVSGAVFGLTATNFSFNGASQYNPPAQALEYGATLGGYVEENLSISERLFLTGSLRVDAGSGFGQQYFAIAYPGVQASWIVVSSQALTFRLRGSLGESGQQPPYGSALQQFTLTPTEGPTGALETGYELSTAGNVHLTPERSTEYEGGFDLALWNNRLTVDFTGYSKTTSNALYSQTLGFDLNNLSYEENIGEIRNTGVEGTVTAVIAESPMFHWTATVNASVNNNKLVTLAPGALLQTAEQGFSVAQYFQAGYPLYSYWAGRVSYSDANHDGILEPDEVTASRTPSFMGTSAPKQEVSLSTNFGFWHDVVAVSALFDSRSDFRVFDLAQSTLYAGDNVDLPVQNVIGTPLWMQSALLASNILAFHPFASPLFEPGDYIRFRELSLTYSLPRPWARAIRVTTLSLTGAVRNLALWTKYSNGDPEVTDPSGNAASYQQGTQSFVANNDIRGAGFSAIPLTRSWVLRLNLGL